MKSLKEKILSFIDIKQVSEFNFAEIGMTLSECMGWNLKKQFLKEEDVALVIAELRKEIKSINPIESDGYVTLIKNSLLKKIDELFGSEKPTDAKQDKEYITVDGESIDKTFSYINQAYGRNLKYGDEVIALGRKGIALGGTGYVYVKHENGEVLYYHPQDVEDSSKLKDDKGVEFYCKNPDCFQHYLVKHKIKSVENLKEGKQEGKDESRFIC